MKEILRLENIEYSYEDDNQSLKGVSLKFHEGEKIALLGQNGSGKSTFFLCCNRVLKPKGKIFLEGKEIKDKKSDINYLRQNIAIVFQDADNQIIAGDVEEEISFGPMNLKLSNQEVKESVDMAIKKMNLESFRHKAPQYLSGGERKRVTIADILAMKPQLILFDEPASSLDIKNKKLLENTLDDLANRNICVIVSTHNMDFAWKWADRIILFHQGEMLTDCKTEEFFEKDDLIEKTELEKPILYSVAKKLGLKKIPRNIYDL